MDVQVRTVSPRHVAYLRALGRYPETFPKLWPQFAQAAGPLGLFGQGATLSIMHDRMGSTPPEQMRGDAACEVPKSFVPSNGLQVQEVPGGLFAVAQYRGPYPGLGGAWSELVGSWMTRNDYRVRSAPSYEIYANDPRTTPADQLLTLLHAPIEKA